LKSELQCKTGSCRNAGAGSVQVKSRAEFIIITLQHHGSTTISQEIKSEGKLSIPISDCHHYLK